MRHVECPKCWADITSSYQRGEVWAWGTGWYCADCDVFVEDDPQDDDYLEERRRDHDR